MEWTFLTNHAHVLVLLARDPRRTSDELARTLGIAEVEVASILRDLQDEGYVSRADVGTAAYVIDRTRPLRHPVEAHHPVGRLLNAVQSPSDVLTDRLSVGG